VPVIADVNMDMSFIDITCLTEINEGDEVEIFGKNSKIENLASAGNTIFYEVLSRISPRVKRIYFN
jgi:alanine racemase